MLAVEDVILVSPKLADFVNNRADPYFDVGKRSAKNQIFRLWLKNYTAIQHAKKKTKKNLFVITDFPCFSVVSSFLVVNPISTILKN